MNIYENELKNIVKNKILWEKISGKTIMISGATGMIGSCLIDLFMMRNSIMKDNIKVIAFSRNKNTAEKKFAVYRENHCFEYNSCDVNNPILDYGPVDYIIHAASNTHPLQYAQDAIGTITSNVIGTRNLLDYGVKYQIEGFCFLSSVEIYGENRGDVDKFDEHYLGYIDCNTLRAGYPESKRLGETLCNAYHNNYNLPFILPRLSRVYGPTMLLSDSKAISQFIKRAASGEDIILKSEGNQIFSYIYVTDAVAGILYAMLLGNQGEAYNVTNMESDRTLKELADLVSELAGLKVIYQIPEEKEQKGYSSATKAVMNAKKLLELGWRPRVDLKNGLKNVISVVSEQMI